MTEQLTAPQPSVSERTGRQLHAATREFARESMARSWGHVISTFAILTAAIAVAVFAPWWPVRVVASLLTALTMVRAFILYHDFMHGAILSRSRAARAVFYVYGALNLTPPRSWRQSHNFHHANVGRIDGSGVGSFPLMTTTMWRNASRTKRLEYRIVRHPGTMLLAYATIFFFSVCLLPLLRRPAKHWDSALSLVAHGAAISALWLVGGFDAALFGLFLPMAVSGALGGYLFYAQHDFQGMRILAVAKWDHYRASLDSSSYLKLSPAMRWFTGNIGFHHVHHLNQLIPFYRLPQAMAGIPELRHPVVTTLHPRDVVACFRANLWDEASGRMVDYRDVTAAA